jgi:hypothetical protein
MIYTYSPVHNVLDACISITRESGRGLGPGILKFLGPVPRRLFFAAQQRIAITLSPEYYQRMQRSTTRKNQEEHGPEVK